MDKNKIEFCEISGKNTLKCRACLKELTNPTPMTLKQKKKFLQITGVELDEMSQEYLCKKCMKLLLISWQFRSEALLADDWFRAQEENVPELKIETEETMEDEKVQENDLGEYSCDICNEKFGSYRKISTHIRIHRKELGRFCRFCDKSFANRTLMSAHEKNHLKRMSNPASSCVCEHCGKDYSNLRQLRMHSRSHRESYKCTMEGCTDAFTQKRAFYSHFAKKHGIARPCVCGDCGNTFSNHLTLKNHRRLFHDDGVKVSCPECPKLCLNQGQLENHIAVKHRGERKHVCDICPRSYGRSTHLKRHYHDSHYDHYLELVKTKKRWKI